MTNVIALNAPPRRNRLSERTGALIDCFARQRRIMDDVFWLKENAELLNILECTGQRVAPSALTPLGDFYATMPDRLAFFPQYYRFFLSIGLDLESLGMDGTQMDRLCAWVADQGLIEAELSDLQRAEARRLLARRGVMPQTADAGLDDRLRAFINRPATFALPNKKAAYELTHIVFYLSEYGRRDPCLDAGAVTSLHYAGILAHLDQNMDLLAEVCVALRQAGQVPAPLWEQAVRLNLAEFSMVETRNASLSDVYHEYLVSCWAVAAMGQDDSGAPVSPGRCVFVRPPGRGGALRAMSAALLDMAQTRSGDWGATQGALMAMLEPDARTILTATADAAPQFDAFFECFARPSSRHR